MTNPDPCPFCGDKIAENSFWFALKDKPPSAHVFCLECDCIGPQRETLDEAVAAWNGRPQPETTSADAALAIGEHAFRAGFKACADLIATDNRRLLLNEVERAWSEYNPPEDIKALTGELSGEPVAWAYEFAHSWKPETGFSDWRKHISFAKPYGKPNQIRNLKALR